MLTQETEEMVIETNNVEETKKPYSEWEQDKLVAEFDKLVAELPNKEWEISLTKEDLQFITHLLNIVPFKAIEAFMICEVRDSIGNQTHKDFKLRSGALEGLWELLLKKYEGRGLKEAQKYVSAANAIAKVVQQMQMHQAMIKEMGFELNKRENPLNESEVKSENAPGPDVESTTTEKKPKGKTKKTTLKVEK